MSVAGREKILESPEPTFEPKVHRHNADVLVIGGGVAGCLAAISSKESGADVLVVEKYNIYSSGDAGTGEDHFIGILGVEDWDNSEEFLATRSAEGTYGPNDQKGKLRNFSKFLPIVTKRLEEIGMPFKDERTGKYFRIQTFGQGHPYTFQFDGSRFKRVIASEVARQGIPIVNRVMMTTIFSKNGRVIGAMGFNHNDGSLHVFNVKAVVISTGEACRLYTSPSGYPFDSWHSPYNTGDGIAMAFKAGAELVDVEFLTSTMCAKGYSTPGTQAFIGMDCHLVNASGERFMKKYDPLWERGPRSSLCWGIHSEIRDGRGPCFIDARHLSHEDLDRLMDTLVVDKGPFGDYLRQKGVDLSKNLLEIDVSEFHLQSGILTDENGQTSVAGMFAAGEGTGSNGVGRAAVEGFIAGKGAAAAATRTDFQEIPEADIKREKDGIYSILKRNDGINSLQFEEAIRQIMSKFVGFDRTESTIKKALESLKAIQEMRNKLSANNFHDLMRSFESKNIFLVAMLVASASLQRRETRIGGSLIAPRADYPDSDPKWSSQLVVLKNGKAENEIAYEIRPKQS